MATKPLELQSLKWPFVGLAVLLALCTGWAVYDEVVPRRPWKNYQREFFKLDEAHARADLERAKKRLEEPETKKKLDAARAGVRHQRASGEPGLLDGFDVRQREPAPHPLREGELGEALRLRGALLVEQRTEAVEVLVEVHGV